jgi:hypothetical protein
LPFALQANGAHEIAPPRAAQAPWPSQCASGEKLLLARSQLAAPHVVVSS